jgi:cysteine-S-conjugate beta-lyase
MKNNTLGEKKIGSFDFDDIIDRRQTGSSKWERYNQSRDILPLWVADMDFKAPPAVIDALLRRTEHGIFGYTQVTAELSQTIITWLDRQYGWQVHPDWLIWLPGSVAGINVACRAVGVLGDEVLSAIPAYPPFLSAPENSGRQLRTVPLLHQDGEWTFDWQRLEEAITATTRLLFFCNPHNPVGRVYRQEELEKLAAICLEHDLIILADEVHADLILDPGSRHLPIATLAPEVARRTITLMGPGKTYNIPGLGFAFAVIPDPGLRKNFLSAMAGIVPEVNLFGWVAAQAAYKDGAEWLQALLSYLRENRDLVAEAVKEMPGLSSSRVEGTYLAWIDARETGISKPAVFFETAGVGLSDGLHFGSPGFLRLNFGCPRAILRQALERMHLALQKGR